VKAGYVGICKDCGKDVKATVHTVDGAVVGGYAWGNVIESEIVWTCSDCYDKAKEAGK
jgi:uncharacterized protein YcfJ